MDYQGLSDAKVEIKNRPIDSNAACGKFWFETLMEEIKTEIRVETWNRISRTFIRSTLEITQH